MLVSILLTVLSARAIELPPLIRESQNILVRQGVCQAAWESSAEIGRLNRVDLDERTELWIVPCSRWAVNQAMTVYLRVRESSAEEGFVTLPQNFVIYKTYEGLRAIPTIQNYAWDPVARVLHSEHYTDASGACGSKADYAYSAGHQTFLLKRLVIKSDCRNAGADWVEMPVAL